MSDINRTTDQSQGGAGSTYRSARESAGQAAQRVGQSAKDNPLAIVAGGLAVGAVVGALLPKTRREDELLGSLGKRIAEGATAAAVAARDVGKEEFSALKPDTGSAKDKAGTIAAHIFDAAKSAATEASRRR